MKVTQRGLTTVARTIARQFGLSVHLDSTKTKTGMTDGRHNIWAGFGVGTDEDATITAGVVVHEAMHGRLTDFNIRGDSVLEKSLLNILQDVWGEREFGKMYRGAPRYINLALEGMVKRGIFQAPKGDEEAPALLTGMLVDGLRSIYLGQTSLAPFYHERRALLEAKLGTNLVGRIWRAAAQVETCDTDARALGIVKEISELLHEAWQDPEQFTEPEPPQQDGGASGSPQSDGSGQPTSSEAGQNDPSSNQVGEQSSSGQQTGGTPSGQQIQATPAHGEPDASAIQTAVKAILEAIESEFGKTDLGDQMRHAIQASGAGPVETPSRETLTVNPAVMAGIKLQAKPLTNRIGATLVHLFDTKREEQIEFRSSGKRIQASRLSGIPVGDSRIFRRTDEMEGVSVAVELVVDCSGSMGSHILSSPGREDFVRLIDAAQQTLFALGETLERAEIPFGVTLFAESVSRYKSMDESWRQACKKKPALKQDGSTLTHSAILKATEDLVFAQEDKRLLIVLTDGLPSHTMQTIAECKELKQIGIDTTFVLINGNGHHGIFKGFIRGLQDARIAHAMAATAADLSGAVFKAVKDA